MIPISDLFNTTRYLKEGGKVIPERSVLIGWFSETMEKDSKMVAVRLAHYSLPLLYSLKSQYTERARKDEVKAKKWLWWVSRTHDVS